MGVVFEYVNLDMYCRICFEQENSLENMINLEDFVPIIKKITELKFMKHKGTPKKICRRCANGLIMASMFRVKVIESNTLCRDFLNSITKIVIEKQSDINVDESDRESDLALQMEQNSFKTDTHDSLDSIIKLESTELSDEYSDPFTEICNTIPMTIKKEPVKSREVMVDSDRSIKIRNNSNTLEHSTKNTEKCFKENRQMFNMKSIKLYNDYEINKQNSKIIRKNTKEQGKRKQLKDVEEISNPMTKTTHKRKKIRGISNYVLPLPDAPVPDDYQCHFSDFVDSESDNEMIPLPWSHPLNQGIELPKVYCSKCRAGFITPNELEVHMEVFHNTKGNTCNLCQRTFTNYANIRIHKHIVHFSGISTNSYKRLICDICGMLTKEIQNHRKTHSEERPYICDLCGFNTKTKYSLRLHFRIHTGEKNFVCTFCQKRFALSSDHYRHEMQHTGNYRHRCLTCGKGYVKKNFLTAHQKTHEAQYATLDSITNKIK